MSKVHITESAINTTFDNCEFNDVDLQNDGENTEISDSQFRSSEEKVIQGEESKINWHHTWWGKIILGVIVIIIAGGAIYYLGW